MFGAEGRVGLTCPYCICTDTIPQAKKILRHSVSPFGLLSGHTPAVVSGRRPVLVIPILLLIYYAGDMGDNAFHMLGLVTEPVLDGLGIKYTVMRDPAKVKEQIAQALTAAEASKRPVALLLTRAVL